MHGEIILAIEDLHSMNFSGWTALFGVVDLAKIRSRSKSL